ncbi:MAG: ABC transporter substrate-binding protein [Hyphomicrobiales bacterium]
MAKTSLTSDLIMSTAMPQYRLNASETVKIGFLGPLTGDVSAWGEPGYQGCRIWEEWINAEGGIVLKDGRHRVEIVPFDCHYDGKLAFDGAKKLIQEDKVKFLMTLGGDIFPPIASLLQHSKTLASTLLPSDLSPDTALLIAPSEVHPIYNVTGVDWLAENKPQLKTAALCAQRDSLGLPSIATYRAAFEAAGIDVVKEIFFSVEEFNAQAIVASMSADAPDILCWDTSYEPFVHALTEEVHRCGLKSQLLSCTADNYRRLVATTSVEFMQGFMFQFPDFDDPALDAQHVNFPRPNVFFDEFDRRFPGNWSAVSWEYVSILDLWRTAVESAGTIEPKSVLAAMKSGGNAKHAFGDARWWGRDLFGIDNALVGSWPVVMIDQGKACTQEFRSILKWWDVHGNILIKHMNALGQMWNQRAVLTPPNAEQGAREPNFTKALPVSKAR